MSKLAEKLENLKVDVKGLLDSSPAKGLSIQTLEEDYRLLCYNDLLSEVIQQGFSTIEDFMKNLAAQGAVNVSYDHSGQMLVSAAHDEKTAHLRRLVQRQVTSKKKKKPALHARHQPSTPHLSSYMRGQIVTLLMQHGIGQGLRLSELEKAYWQRYASELDVSKFGFADLRSAVLSLQCDEPSISISPIAWSPGAAEDLQITLRQPATALATSRQQQQPDLTKKFSTSIGSGNVSRVDHQNDTTRPPKPQSGSAGGFSSTAYPEQTAHGRVAVAAHGDRPAVVKSTSECRAPFKTLAVASTMAPAVVDLVNRAAAVAAPPAAVTAGSNGDRKSNASQVFLSKHLQEAVYKAVSSAGPEGIVGDKLLVTYKQLFGRELSYRSLRYPSLAALVTSVSGLSVFEDSNTAEARFVAVHPLVVSAAPVADAAATTGAAAVATSSPHPARLLRGGERNIGGAIPLPADASAYRATHLPKMVLPDWAEQQRRLRVRVISIESPSRFHMQLSMDVAVAGLTSLMDKLSDTYNAPLQGGLACVVSAAAIRVGLLCAAQIGPRLWYRAVIVALLESEQVKVATIDYGSTASVKLTSLRLLKAEFLQLPSQAIAGCLGEIAPAPAGGAADADGWTHAAATEMRQVCQRKCFEAELLDTASDGRLLVRLTDDSGQQHVDVARELVRRSCAVDRRGSPALVHHAHGGAASLADTRSRGGAAVGGQLCPRAAEAPSGAWSTAKGSEDLQRASDVDELTYQSRTGHLYRRSALNDRGLKTYIVTCEGLDYITSSELYSYVTCSPQRLALMMEQSRFPHIKLCVDDSICLIDELQKLGLRCDDGGYQGITLYELQNISAVLEAGGCRDEQLIQTFRRFDSGDCSELPSFDAEGYPRTHFCQLMRQRPSVTHTDVPAEQQQQRLFYGYSQQPIADVARAGEWPVASQLDAHASRVDSLSTKSYGHAMDGPMPTSRGRGLVSRTVPFVSGVGRGRGNILPSNDRF